MMTPSHTLVWRRWRLTLVLHSVTGKLVVMDFILKTWLFLFLLCMWSQTFYQSYFLFFCHDGLHFSFKVNLQVFFRLVLWHEISSHLHLTSTSTFLSLPTGWRPWLAGSRRFRLSKRMQRNQQRRRKARLLTRRLLPRLHWSTPALSAG